MVLHEQQAILRLIVRHTLAVWLTVPPVGYVDDFKLSIQILHPLLRTRCPDDIKRQILQKSESPSDGRRFT